MPKVFFPNAAKLIEETPSGTPADPFEEMHQSPLEKHRQHEDAADSEHGVGTAGRQDDDGPQRPHRGRHDLKHPPLFYAHPSLKRVGDRKRGC